MGIKKYISVGLGLFLVVIIFGNFVSAQINIEMYDYLISQDVTHLPNVPINISDCSNIGSAHIVVYYDGSILNATACSFNASNFMSGFCDRSVLGRVDLIIGASRVGVHGKCTAGFINFNVNTSAVGKRSNLSIQVVELVDKGVPPSPLSYTVRNGSVTVSCVGATCPAGTFCNTTTHLCQPFLCYGDADNDGYGNLTNTTLAIVGVGCRQGYVNKSNDCNDYNASINPEKPEIYYNGIDDDCNISTRDCDQDNDGYNATIGVCAGTDCNDTNANINPGVNETCNEIDDDCDGQIDDECCTPFDLDGNKVIDIFDVVAGLKHLSYGTPIDNENCTARDQRQIDLFDLLTLISRIGTNTI